MDYLSKNVAANLKRIRKSKCMSLDQAAEQTGVSKSMLAQIERGTANPSPRVDCCLVTPEELLPTKELEGQYRVWTCLPYEDTRLIEVYRIEVEPGGIYVSGSHGEKTREYLVVTEGVLTVECHGQSCQIRKDQVFKFETDQDHIYRNESGEKACCTCFFLDYHGKQ